MHIFHSRVKELREERGLTQAQLSKEINFASNHISQWETGQKRTSFEGLCALAKFFDVTIDYLLGIEDQFGNKV